MGLTKPMREAMKAGKEVDLKQYIDITPFSYNDYKDTYSVRSEAKSPADNPPPKTTIQQAAVLTLMGLGLTHAEANTFVCAALVEEQSGCPTAPIIARKAYQMYLANPQSTPQKSSPLSGLCGYESLKEAGVIENEAV
ncbi:MAG: hypothetical protein IJ803_02590 [Oribacterium sp.]|nr:hypothetical protein [Oribacterium sp.]